MIGDMLCNTKITTQRLASPIYIRRGHLRYDRGIGQPKWISNVASGDYKGYEKMVEPSTKWLCHQIGASNKCRKGQRVVTLTGFGWLDGSVRCCREIRRATLLGYLSIIRR